MQQAQRGPFDAARHIVQTAIAVAPVELLGGACQDVGARIANPVDAVAESHDALAAIQLRANDRLGAVRRADFEHHVERGTGRAAVQRTFERADGAGDGRDHVRSRGRDDARRERGGVETVIADGIEISLQRAGALR